MSLDNLSGSTASFDYPETRPTLDLNFARTKTLDPRINFSRSSGGTFVGPDGLIKIAGVNQPRFDHNPVTGESLGLLIEESRQNFVTNSVTMTRNTSNYVGANGGTYTFTANQTVSPDGGINAGSIVFTGSQCGIALQSTGTTSTTITLSIFAKYVIGSALSHVRIQLSPFGGGSNYGLFNLINGTFSSNGNVFNVNMTRFSNDWYRCSVTATHTTTWPQNAGDLRIWFHGATPTESTINNTDSVYVWGTQLEQGSFNTSYIPTSGSAVTRASDNANITGTNFSSWYVNSSSTFSLKGIFNSPSAQYNTYGIFVVGTGYMADNNRRMRIIGNQFAAIGNTGVMANSEFNLSSPVTPGGAYNYAVSYDDSGHSACSPSDFRSTIYPSLPLQTVTTLQFYPDAYRCNHTISRITYWPRRLTDRTLRTLVR